MSVKQKAGLWILAIAVGLLLFITFAVPQIAKYYAKAWLIDQGAQQAEIASIQFNPFLGRVAIQDIRYQMPEAEPVAIDGLSLEVQWRSLWSRRIHLTELQLTGASTPLIVSEEKMAIGKLEVWQATQDTEPQEPQEETESKPWYVQLDKVQLNDWQLPILLFGTETSLHIESLMASALDTSAVEQPVHIEFSGDVNEDPVKWITDITAFAEQPVITGRWRFDELDLARFAPLMGEDMAQLSGVLEGDTDVRVSIKEQGIEVDQDGELALSGFNLPGILQSDSLTWSGKIGLILTFDEAVGSLDLQGDLNSEQLQPVVESMRILLGKAHWQGELAMASLSDVNTLTTTSTLNANNLQLSDGTNDQTISQVALQGIKIEPDLAVMLENITVDDVVLATTENPEADLTLQQVSASQVQYSSEGVKIEDSQISDIVLSVVRDAQGNWQLPYAMAGAATDTQTEAETDPSDSPALAIEVGEFRITGDSKIAIDDRSVAPAANNTLQLEKLSVSDISTKDGSGWSPFTVAINHGEYGKLTFDGKLRNPGAEMDLELDSEIEQLDLHDWSSYLASATGYQVKHGVLDSSLDVNVDKGKLDAQTNWMLHNLEVERADDELAQQMEASMSMPLESALSMLRDGDNNIELKIPVTGDLHSPDFDISSVMNKAIATALKKTTMTYLKYALQPYGALLLIGEAVGKAGEVKFTPVEYAPQQTELSAASVDYLTKIGELLQQRPEMRIQVCGFATRQDLSEEQRQQLEEQAAEKPTLPDEVKTTLMDMANQRADAVKQYMVENYSVEPARLFTCLPKVELSQEAAPRVELSL